MEGMDREKLLECRIAGTSDHQVDDIIDSSMKEMKYSWSETIRMNTTTML